MQTIKPGHTIRSPRAASGDLVLIQRVREFSNGGLDITYRYADNKSGISFHTYIGPDELADVEIVSYDPDIATDTLSLLP